MKTLSVLMALVGLAAAADADTWECGSESGCTARINNDGNLDEVLFRKGDLVDTEAGWIVSPDDGWEKIRPKASLPAGGSGAISKLWPVSPLVGGGEVSGGSSWSGGLSSVTVNMSVNPTVNTVTVNVSNGNGQSADTTGTPGPSSSASDPTCSDSGEMQLGGGTFRVRGNKLQRKTKAGQWVNMRQRKAPPGDPNAP